MSKKNREPIMSPDDECFMAFTGLIQWTQGVIRQSTRVTTATEQLTRIMDQSQITDFPTLKYSLNCEEHYFTVAANKLIEHCEWSR